MHALIPAPRSTSSRFERAIRIIVLITLSLLVNFSSAFGQGFGKNKVQYETFEWRYIQSEHFNVYFTEGGERIAEFTAETAEAALAQIEEHWNYDLEGRITIVTYRSHNNFQQTNVTFQLPEESLGGFTEFFKNRVVIPFTGNYEAYRHVVHHELTHAVNLRFFYGSGFQSILIGASTSNIPLWFSEGLAEYESRGGWDVEADMFMRDATISGYLPNIDQLGGYFAYKGGQSVFYFLDRRYGAEKVGEFVNKVRNTRDVERALRSAVGLEMEEFNREWQNWLRRIYWPTVADLISPDKIGERLTKHREWRNFVNNGAGISPDGMKVAFLSDRTDYFDIWLYDIESDDYDRILRGERSGGFEQLKWLDARISWSPDGKFVTFATKAGARDAVYVLDVEKRKITHTLRFDLDGIFNPVYSPDGTKIAFVGQKNGQSDLYYYDLATEHLTQVTDDVFSDDDPTWSANSEELVFVSDRQDSLRVVDENGGVKLWLRDYRQMDIYKIHPGDTFADRLPATFTSERFPVLTPDGRFMSYSSDANGIWNLYRRNIETGETEAITNCLTGCLQPSHSLNTQRLLFTSFYEGGYDIYLLKNAGEAPLKQLEPTNFRKRGTPEPQQEPDSTEVVEGTTLEIRDDTRPYSNYIFRQGEAIEGVPTEIEEQDTVSTRKPGGGFFNKKYKVKFTPDFVYATAAYSSFFGAQGTGQILLSDVLGNHLIFINTDLYYDFNNLDNSNFSAQYFYLPRRVNYGVGLFRYVYYLDAGNVRDQTWQTSISTAYPFSKYTRAELNIGGYAIDRARWQGEPVEDYRYEQRRRVILPELAYVHDTALWGVVGPVNGARYRLSYAYSPKLGENKPPDRAFAEFYTAKGDVRNYFRLGRDYTWASRFTAGLSGGPDAQRFFLGGVSNWINRRFENNEIPTDEIDIFYFSSFVTPFRGGDYFEKRGTGNRFFLTNQEFRFPLIRYLQLGWPLPLGFRDIRGSLFTDIGAAWDDETFKFTRIIDGKRRLYDPQVAYGLGMRTWVWFFILRWDVAWSTDMVDTSRPLYYFSIGSEF